MRLMLMPLATVLLLSNVPTVESDSLDTCETITSLWYSSERNFEDVRGRKDPDDSFFKVYEGPRIFNNVAQCEVEVDDEDGDNETRIICRAEFRGMDEAHRTHQVISSDLRECDLPSNEYDPSKSYSYKNIGESRWSKQRMETRLHVDDYDGFGSRMIIVVRSYKHKSAGTGRVTNRLLFKMEVKRPS